MVANLLFRRRGSLIYGLPTLCVHCTVYSLYFRKNYYPVYCLLFFKMIVV